MGPTGEARLWLVQRAAATVMIPLILAHLFTTIYAVQGGLSAAEILGRTRGNPGWAAFYGLFVFSASVHGAIGLRTVAREWLRWDGWRTDITVAAIFVILTGLGLRAVAAVVWGV